MIVGVSFDITAVVYHLLQFLVIPLIFDIILAHPDKLKIVESYSADRQNAVGEKWNTL